MRNRKKPGILGSLIKSLSDLTENEAKKRVNQGNTFKSPRTTVNRRLTGMKTCQYWNCNRPIRPNHFLCAEHYEDWEDYLIDKCPECGRYKDVGFDYCKDCYDKLKRKSIEKKTNSKIRIEHSKVWGKGDEGVEKFFVYILKDDTGSFYVGHTRDLRIRLGEHRDGKTKSTRGRNLKLQYFEEVNSRKHAELQEVEQKNLVNSNERKIRKMIRDFQDRVREVQIS